MKKVLITTIMAATLLTTSIGVFAAANTITNKDANPKITTKTAMLSDITKDPSNTTGKIEYSRSVYIRADGSEGMTFETWTDPKTFSSRADNIIKIDGKVEDNNSTYSKDKGRSIIMLHKDENILKKVSKIYQVSNRKKLPDFNYDENAVG
jgi:hypothetical protein